MSQNWNRRLTMSKIFTPKDGEVYGFKFKKNRLNDETLWLHDDTPRNNLVIPMHAAHYKSDYKVVNNCVLTKNPLHPNQILNDRINSYFQINLTGALNLKYRERINLPVYYIKMDGYKQLLYKCKSVNFGRIPIDNSQEQTYFRLNELKHTTYTDEYQYYAHNDQLNCSMIFQKSGYAYMYDIEDEYQNLRVTEPILSEIIFFV